DGQDVTIVSKDLPMRVKAASLGLTAEEYLAEQAVDSGWTGIASIDLSGDEMADLYESEIGLSEDVRGVPVNTGLIIHSERGSAGSGPMELSGGEMAGLYARGRGLSGAVRGVRATTGLVSRAARGSALGRVVGDGAYRRVRGDREVFGLHGRSAEQRLAIDLL